MNDNFIYKIVKSLVTFLPPVAVLALRGLGRNNAARERRRRRVPLKSLSSRERNIDPCPG